MSDNNLDAMCNAEGPKCSYEDIHEDDVDVADIIDVLEFDDSDNDRWLDGSVECSESRVRDLNAWLRSDPESDNGDVVCGTRRSIDTRTFTRIKRRSNRLSFDTFMDPIPSTSNVWKNEVINESSLSQNEQKEIPYMLRPKTNILTSLFSESPSSISSQRSMEAFLDLAQAKGIDSFINMAEPDFDLLMNTSQPSMLYSSMLSERDDSIRNNAQDAMIDSQILTESMMQASMFQETQDLSSLDFGRCEVTIVENTEDRTFINENDIFELSEESSGKSDETFTAPSPGSTTRTLSAENSFDQKCEISPKPLNETKNLDCLESEDTFNIVSQANDFDTTKDIDVEPLGSAKVTAALNSTYQAPNTLNTTKVIVSSLDDVKELSMLDDRNTTFVASSSTPLPNQFLDLTIDINCPKENFFNSTFNTSPTKKNELIEHVHTGGKKFNSTFDYPLEELDEKILEENNGGKNFDSTFDYLPRQEERRVCDQTFDQMPKQNFNATYNRPGDQKKAVKKNLDVTYDQTQQTILDSNRFSTYRKDTFKVQNKITKLPEANLEKNRFSTYSKKTGSVFADQVAEPKKSVEPADFTFTKPISKLQRRTIQAPKTLSKLPHLFQKSNPNLAAKPVGATSRLPSFGYAKETQLSARNKPQPLGKHKSGSDQRLMEVTHTIAEFQMTGTGGSMESIESTQSAHSAPDLDDRLSMCSDSSHHSYTIKPMNITQLHKIAQLQEEDSTRSTPIKRQVLENTWVSEKDLPSPILKNGSDHYECSSNSSRSSEPNIKTSSPNLSPANSDQTINIISNHSKENTRAIANQVDKTAIKKPTAPITQSRNSVIKKTGLKPPTNFTGTRPTSASSGIPRPASRIPGPMFTRPKNHQALKKGC